MLNIKTFTFNPLQEHCYLVWDGTGAGALIDPGCYGEAELGALKEYVAAEKVSVRAIWLTHGHFDHVFGVSALVREYGVPVLMHPADRDILEDFRRLSVNMGLYAPDLTFRTAGLREGQILRLAQDDKEIADDGREAQDFSSCFSDRSSCHSGHRGESPAFRVIETPGHSPGGVCFYDEADKVLFSGDTLFAGSIGRTDHPGGDYDKLIASIMEKLMGLPGDVDVLPGHGPRTTLADERTRNPFLQPFNEPDPDRDAAGIELHGFGE